MSNSSIFIISDNNSVLAEFCAGARKLTSTTITAIIFGDESVANSVTSCGADKIVYCPVSSQQAPEDFAKAIAETIKKSENATVLVNNSIRGRCLAGKISVYLNTAVISGINELELCENKLVSRRIVYGGMAQRKETFANAYSVYTVASGIFDVDIQNNIEASIEKIDGEACGTLRRISKNEKKESAVNLVAAKRIVDIGRGLAAQEDLNLIQNLAKVLGADVGCSRPVAENNKWMPKSSYIGITGVVVKPELLFAIGVSGQVQHIGGINKSKVIIAINKDKAAPIFKNADFGIVGDMYKIIPALIEKLS